MNKILRILIIDESPDDVKRIEQQLHDDGVAFSSRVVSGKDSYTAALHEFAPDIVLSEVCLAKIDCKEIVGILHENSPQTPCIIVTGASHEDAALACLQAGAADYLIKDNLHRLCPALNSILEKKNLNKELLLTQEALTATSNRYQSVMEHTSEGIVITNENFLMLFTNQEMCRITGYSREETVGKNFLLLLDEKSREIVQQIFSEPGHAQADASREIGIVSKDGSSRQVMLSKSSFTTPDGGTLTTLIFHNITERKHYENILLAQNAIIEQAMDGIALSDSTGTMLYVNPAWAQMHGRDTGEMSGAPLSMNFTEHQYEQEIVPLINKLRKQGAWRGEVSHTKKDGTIFKTQMSVFLMRDEKGLDSGFVGFARDITEELELKHQLIQSQRMEAIGALAGGMAHDLNNMLSPILGYAGMLLEEMGPGDEKFKKIFQIQRCGERARDLINNLLTFSRKQHLEMKIQDLGEIVETYEGMLRRMIREDISFEIIYNRQSTMIMADASQIGQLLLNLTMNAQDAMPHGGKLSIKIDNVELDGIYCQSHPEASAGPHAHLIISDTGHGMSAEITEHIFEPFFTTKDVEQKTGLGLSTVYGIVRQHGGHITVKSREMWGTTFNIYLPREEFIPYEQKPALINDHQLRGTETVFVVEDSQSVCELACAMLQKYGYTVLSANGPEECLRILKSYQGPIHLLLTDIVLPSMNGKQLADIVTATSPETKIIYMSGYAQDIIASRGVVKERVNFLQKPFTIKTLMEKVRQTLDESLQQPSEADS